MRKYIKKVAHFNIRAKNIKYFLSKRLRSTITERVPMILPIWTIEPYNPKDFAVDAAARTVTLTALRSGYAPDELARPEDPYADKSLHRAFAAQRRPRTDLV